MTLVVKSSDKSVIAIPAELLKQLNLQEGDEVKITVEKDGLRLQRLNDFLSLAGALKDDPEFDAALEYLDKAWRQWKPGDSS